MKQQETFALSDMVHVGVLNRLAFDEVGAGFLLGRAITILEGLVESPTDAIDIQLAQDLLADYRKWIERES